MSDNEIVRDFLAESYENLDQLDREIVNLEKNPADRDALASVFRTIHTIKGTCGFLGFPRLEKVAHAGENLLSPLRDGNIILNPEITTALLETVDAIRQMLAEIQATGQDGNSEYADLLERLKQLQTPNATAAVLPEEPATEASGPAELKAHTPARDKLGGVLVEHGLISAERLADALQKQHEGDSRQIGDILVSQGAVQGEIVALAQQVAESRSSAAAGTIRVGVNLLDNLMTLVGELVLARNQLFRFANSSEDPSLQVISQHMRLITSELQEQVMKTRMQPIGNIWNQFPRTVRDLAVSCKKEVRIEMQGKEIELDKTIIEAIKDPLMHLVRNSVDHGIEHPEERVKAGKSSTGRLILRAFHEGGQVNIEISDDGAGIHRERIRQKAVECGIVSLDQAARLSDREILNLVFAPGLSTAAQLTNISGRGVGMDVVKTNIEKIGGAVDIQSRIGEGTTIRIRIPLTLAIIPALIVGSRGERFAIPQVNLVEAIGIAAGDAENRVERVHGAPVYRLDGRLIPLVYLGKELQIERANEAKDFREECATKIVVVQAGKRRIGLVVDEINDAEDIVVKPLCRQLKSMRIFAGASIMGDGTVVLILDVAGLAQRFGIASEALDGAACESAIAALENTQEKQTFLLFAGEDDARMALPIEALQRLEQFPASQIEQHGSQWAVQYRGRILPLLHLEHALDERRRRRRNPRPGADTAEKQCQVLVCQDNNGQTAGIVVERILDIVDDAAEVRYPATRTGIRYSTVLKGRVTELLDLSAILASSGLQRAQELAPDEVVH
jgi:two-component system, chemotaxis family, sensor kinase CheA